METLAWADLAPGQDLPLVEKPPITKVQLVKYAGASGDYNLIHTDEETARRVGLDGVIAHGMLSMGFLGDYAAELVGAAGFVQQLKVRFAGMVRPGDVLTLRGKVIEKDEANRTARIAIFAEREPEKPLTSGEALLRFSHAPAKRSRATVRSDSPTHKPTSRAKATQPPPSRTVASGMTSRRKSADTK